MDKQQGTLQLNFKDNIKTIVVDGVRFTMNLDDPQVYSVLFEFKNNHEYNPLNIENNVDELLNDCEKTIDTVLGEGSCDKLFDKKSMKMYLLVNELANIFLDNFMKDERMKKEEQNKKEMADLNKILDSMNNIVAMMNYANKKYSNRGSNYVPNRRTTKNNKNKRK